MEHLQKAVSDQRCVDRRPLPSKIAFSNLRCLSPKHCRGGTLLSVGRPPRPHPHPFLLRPPWEESNATRLGVQLDCGAGTARRKRGNGAVFACASRHAPATPSGPRPSAIAGKPLAVGSGGHGRAHMNHEAKAGSHRKFSTAINTLLPTSPASSWHRKRFSSS